MPAIGDTVVGRYELRSTLGVSATRVAYCAFDVEVEVEVALWCLHPELFPTDPSRATFVAAANQIQGIRHRHLLKVFEAGHLSSASGDLPSLYLTQQLATSAELEGRLRAGASNDATAIVRYAASVGGALDAIHSQGLHHGWLTPADVVEVAGQVKLCGAGLFASMEAGAALARFGDDRRYLAPEVVAGRPPSAASDWYSLGVILLELATGAPVKSPQRALESLAATTPAYAVALRPALAANPAERPADATDFLAAVEHAWQQQAVARMESQPPVNLESPAEEANFDKTVSMGQSFIDANVAAVIAGGKDAAAEMMVSEVEVDGTDASVATPPGGFDEGVTVASVATPPGGFDEGVTVASVATPPGGFDEGDTVHRALEPPMGFDDDRTEDRPPSIVGEFDQSKTQDRPAPPNSGFNDGPTVDSVIAPRPSPDIRATAKEIPAIQSESDGRATARHLSAGRRALTARQLPMVGSSADRRQTAQDIATPTGEFADEETDAAQARTGGFHVDDATMDLPADLQEAQTVAEDTLPPGGFDEGETVVDGAPRERLLALSMKPEAETEPRRKVHAGLAAKPVLRPLSSLAETPNATPALGVLAPPRLERAPPGNRRLWLGLSLVLVAGAVTVTLALVLSGGDGDTNEDPGADVPDLIEAEVPTQPAAPREVVVLGPTCDEGSVHIAASNLCVDAFEAPGVGRQPQSGLSLAEARASCGTREMRLCTAAEWEMACGGAEATEWPYGKRYKAEICNLKGRTIELAGTRAQCRSSFATYDMSGNIAEWVEEGEIRGGSALDRSRGSCTQIRKKRRRQSAFSDVGFRCCADAIASPPPSD